MFGGLDETNCVKNTVSVNYCFYYYEFFFITKKIPDVSPLRLKHVLMQRLTAVLFISGKEISWIIKTLSRNLLMENPMAVAGLMLLSKTGNCRSCKVSFSLFTSANLDVLNNEVSV